MRYKHELFTDYNTGVHTRTIEQAKHLIEASMPYSNKKNPLAYTVWNTYKDQTVIIPYGQLYGDIEHCEEYNYKVYKYEDVFSTVEIW